MSGTMGQTGVFAKGSRSKAHVHIYEAGSLVFFFNQGSVSHQTWLIRTRTLRPISSSWPACDRRSATDSNKVRPCAAQATSYCQQSCLPAFLQRRVHVSAHTWPLAQGPPSQRFITCRAASGVTSLNNTRLATVPALTIHGRPACAPYPESGEELCQSQTPNTHEDWSILLVGPPNCPSRFRDNLKAQHLEPEVFARTLPLSGPVSFRQPRGSTFRVTFTASPRR